jgi:hypothetical protein
MTMSKPSTGAKHRLLVSTAMLGVLCLGYGRRAYAACSGAGGTYNRRADGDANLEQRDLVGDDHRPVQHLDDSG